MTEQAKVKQYQTFGDRAGDSDSAEKLRALRLDYLRLAGKSVLDIGCNEGFFCDAVRDLGASRVVGLDVSEDFISRARARSPDLTFIVDSWWNLPDEKFDVILFLSAIHYEPEQKLLLDKLIEHLTPSGTLVLECGVAPDEKYLPAWRQVYRNASEHKPLRFPTISLLERHLLSSYATRWVGESVTQKGDPVPRKVYHCTPRQPIAIIAHGPTLTGKSTLAATLSEHSVSTYSTDDLLHRLAFDDLYVMHPLSTVLRQLIENEPDWSLAAERMVANDQGELLGEVIAEEAPLEPVFVVEGEAIRHGAVREGLRSRLTQRGCRVWGLTPIEGTTTVYEAAPEAGDE